LRLCIVAKEYNNILSGVGAYSTNLINGLAKRGFQLTVLCPQSCLTDRKSTFTEINFVPTPAASIDLRHANWIFNAYNFSNTLKKQLKTKKADLVHFTEAREALFFRRRESMPIIGTLHDYHLANSTLNVIHYQGIYPKDWPKRLVYYNCGHFVEKICLRRLDHIITVSRAAGKILHDRYNLSNKRISVVHNGIDLALTTNRCEGYPKERKNSILFVGNNFQRKGLATLIKASKLITNQMDNVKFIIVGNDPGVENEMKTLCNTYNVSRYFDFRGFVNHDELANFYKSSNILAHPPLVENFPYSILESFSYGLPVIATSVGGIPELVCHGENGFLIEPRDYETLAKYILILLRNKKSWERMSRNCKETAERFSTETMVKKTVEVYKNIL